MYDEFLFIEERLLLYEFFIKDDLFKLNGFELLFVRK